MHKGRYTVPVLWDLKKETIVNNESAEIVRIFNEGFDSILGEDVGAEGESKAKAGGEANGEAKEKGKDERKEREEKGKKVDVYPEGMREGIDEINGWIYEHISSQFPSFFLPSSPPRFRSPLPFILIFSFPSILIHEPLTTRTNRRSLQMRHREIPRSLRRSDRPALRLSR
jgi:hypothetical protein